MKFSVGYLQICESRHCVRRRLPDTWKLACFVAWVSAHLRGLFILRYINVLSLLLVTVSRSFCDNSAIHHVLQFVDKCSTTSCVTYVSSSWPGGASATGGGRGEVAVYDWRLVRFLGVSWTYSGEKIPTCHRVQVCIAVSVCTLPHF